MPDPIQRDLVALVPERRRSACGLTGLRAEGGDRGQAARESGLRDEARGLIHGGMHPLIRTLWRDHLRKGRMRGLGMRPTEADIDSGGDREALVAQLWREGEFVLPGTMAKRAAIQRRWAAP